jgi:cell division control protein 7
LAELSLPDRTIISNVPTVDHAPESLTHLVLKLNPHLYTPQISQPTPQEAKKHITDVDNAIDLCSRLLRLDHTKRLTAAQSLRHAFFRTDPKDQGEQDVFVDIGEGKCGRLHAIDTDGKREWDGTRGETSCAQCWAGVRFKVDSRR